MDKGGDLEDALKDQMDFETLRDMVPADKLREGFQRMAENPAKILNHYFGD